LIHLLVAEYDYSIDDLRDSLDVMKDTYEELRLKLINMLYLMNESGSGERKLIDANRNINFTLEWGDGIIYENGKRIITGTHQVFFHPPDPDASDFRRKQSILREGANRLIGPPSEGEKLIGKRKAAGGIIAEMNRVYGKGGLVSRQLGEFDRAIVTIDTRGIGEFKKLIKDNMHHIDPNIDIRFFDDIEKTPEVEKYTGLPLMELAGQFLEHDRMKNIIEGVLYSRYVGLKLELEAIKFFTDMGYEVLQSGRNAYKNGQYVTELGLIVRQKSTGRVFMVECKSSRQKEDAKDVVINKMASEVKTYRDNWDLIEQEVSKKAGEKIKIQGVLFFFDVGRNIELKKGLTGAAEQFGLTGFDWKDEKTDKQYSVRGVPVHVIYFDEIVTRGLEGISELIEDWIENQVRPVQAALKVILKAMKAVSAATAVVLVAGVGLIMAAVLGIDIPQELLISGAIWFPASRLRKLKAAKNIDDIIALVETVLDDEDLANAPELKGARIKINDSIESLGDPRIYSGLIDVSGVLDSLMEAFEEIAGYKNSKGSEIADLAEKMAKTQSALREGLILVHSVPDDSYLVRWKTYTDRLAKVFWEEYAIVFTKNMKRDLEHISAEDRLEILISLVELAESMAAADFYQGYMESMVGRLYSRLVLEAKDKKIPEDQIAEHIVSYLDITRNFVEFITPHLDIFNEGEALGILPLILMHSEDSDEYLHYLRVLKDFIAKFIEMSLPLGNGMSSMMRYLLEKSPTSDLFEKYLDSIKDFTLEAGLKKQEDVNIFFPGMINMLITGADTFSQFNAFLKANVVHVHEFRKTGFPLLVKDMVRPMALVSIMRASEIHEKEELRDMEAARIYKRFLEDLTVFAADTAVSTKMGRSLMR
ncbi:hypothetical protein ACFLTD_05530, partial [Elusimicrobiota bacterium]